VIRITQRGWQHILKHHTGMPSPSHANKSTFYPGEDLVQLINQAAQSTPAAKRRQHLVRIFDAGHPVGIDRHSKKSTSTVTVITKLNGELVNMFPGLP
jgi:hypothetical protein